MSGKAMTALLAGLSVLCLVAVGILWSNGAQAQQPCGPIKEIMEFLSGPKYKELPFAHADGPSGPMLFFLNSETGTFTLVGVRPDGKACLLATAENFTLDEPDPIKPGQGT